MHTFASNILPVYSVCIYLFIYCLLSVTSDRCKSKSLSNWTWNSYYKTYPIFLLNSRAGLLGCSQFYPCCTWWVWRHGCVQCYWLKRVWYQPGDWPAICYSHPDWQIGTHSFAECQGAGKQEIRILRVLRLFLCKQAIECAVTWIIPAKAAERLGTSWLLAM